MKQIVCALKERSYPIYVGAGLLKKAGALIKAAQGPGLVLVVTNKRVFSLYYETLRKSLEQAGCTVSYVLLPDSEEAKSWKQVERIHHALLARGADRHATVIALGGGVIGDVSGFAASTYMRGIPFVNIPTTILAQVDSAIGGKTAINLSKGKNLVGTFYQPRMVISDQEVLGSLSRAQRIDSLSEIIKYGIIRDGKFFAYCEDNLEKALKGDTKVLEHMVCVSSTIKARIVSQDEFETTGVRALLNLGHTFAHGFEAAGKYKKMSHGIAVAVGILAATRVAVAMSVCSHRTAHRIERIVTRLGIIPSRILRGISMEHVLCAMQCDKKKKGGKLSYILPVRIGKAVVSRSVPEDIVKTVLRTL